jgi:hypothetical protein
LMNCSFSYGKTTWASAPRSTRASKNIMSEPQPADA